MSPDQFTKTGALTKQLNHDNGNHIRVERYDQKFPVRKPGPRRFTCYTDTGGKWTDRGFNTWCCGFFAGLMWMMYSHTGDKKWADYGRDWNDSIRPKA